MNFFQQSNFSSSRKIPKIDIDFDPMKMFNSLFSSNSSNIQSFCESCNTKFGFIKTKKTCDACKFNFCVSCFKLETDLGKSAICTKCRVFSKKPLRKEDLNKLKIKELKWFLRSHRISSSLCKEKSDLVDLIIQHFGLRTNNQSSYNSNQAGPSRRSFDENSNGASNAFKQRSESIRENLSSISQDTSPLSSASNSNNLNSDNVESGTLESDSSWNIINEQFNSNNNSTENSNSNSNNNLISNLEDNFRNQPLNNQTLTNESDDVISEFINITAEQTNNETNSDVEGLRDAINFCDKNDSQTNDDLLNLTDRNNSSDQNDGYSGNNLRPTPLSFRLSNPNLNNLNKSTNNLNGSTESLTTIFNIQDVKSEDEIRNLNVRQLKLVLTRNYVNYKGCCEKEELQEKAIRLWNQIKQENDSLNDEKDEDLCKICMENIINCVLLECGHLVTCLDCGKRLNECPICRQFVVRAIRTFKS